MSAVYTAVVLAAVAVQQNRQSNKESRRARRIQEKSQRLQSGRQAIESVRNAQIQRAKIIQSGENQGVAGSSAVLGGAGSVQSQAGANIGFSQQIFDLHQQANRRLDKAQEFAGDAQAASSFSSVAGGFVGE